LAGVKAKLPYHLPTEYISFLRLYDGATIRFAEGEFILYPLIHPRSMPHARPSLGRTTVVNTYEIIEKHRPDHPLFVIGHGVFGVEEDIGFARTDLIVQQTDCPIHVFWHESGEYDSLAPSFRDFISGLAVIPEDQMYIPPWMLED
jgi:hypothetical protein